jgi:hypothetical protein
VCPRIAWTLEAGGGICHVRVVEASGLEKTVGETSLVIEPSENAVEVLSSDDGADNQDEEQDENRKIDDRVAETMLAETLIDEGILISTE